MRGLVFVLLLSGCNCECREFCERDTKARGLKFSGYTVKGGCESSTCECSYSVPIVVEVRHSDSRP